MRKVSNLSTAAHRRRLETRREPYWVALPTGGYLGYRKTGNETGTWLARYKPPGAGKIGSGAYKTNPLQLALGTPGDEAYNLAAKEAAKWIEERVSGAVKAASGGYKLSDAADAYLKALRARKGDGAADDAEGRIDRKLKKSSIWSRRVDRLSKDEVEEWLYGMVPKGLDEEGARKAKDSANRNLTTLKAILNHAWKAQRVASPNAWATAQAYENVAKSRRVFLTLEQRRRLLDHTDGAFKNLLEAAMLTGARYGELRQLRVEDFDKAARRLEIHKGKTGVRTVALSDAANSFFARISKNKLPGAPLLPRDDGQPWAHSDQDELMRAATKKAKLPRETVFYTLRHTYIASALPHVDIASIAKNCGTSVRIIERNYSKFIPENISAKLNQVALT